MQRIYAHIDDQVFAKELPEMCKRLNRKPPVKDKTFIYTSSAYHRLEKWVCHAKYSIGDGITKNHTERIEHLVRAFAEEGEYCVFWDSQKNWFWIFRKNNGA